MASVRQRVRRRADGKLQIRWVADWFDATDTRRLKINYRFPAVSRITAIFSLMVSGYHQSAIAFLLRSQIVGVSHRAACRLQHTGTV
jgi:hypothetical protein